MTYIPFIMLNPQVMSAVYLFQLLTILFTLHKRQQRRRAQSIQQSQAMSLITEQEIDQEIDDVSAFLTTLYSQHNPRAVWIKDRSSHWATNVLNGKLLKGKEF